MEIKEVMKQGYLYTDYGKGKEELEKERLYCQKKLYEYNLTKPDEMLKRNELLYELLDITGESCWIEPPLKCAYGYRIHIKDHFYANFNLVIVDDIDVYIGSHVMFAPNVCISTTSHPILPSLRKAGVQFSLPVIIEDDVWIGANATILPGVHIGKGSVIGAGSVVTHDIEAGVVAYGVPCKVARKINEEDALFYNENRKIADCPTWAYKDE